MPTSRDVKVIVILGTILTALVATIAVYFEGHNELRSIQTAYCTATASVCDIDWVDVVFDLAGLAVFLFAVITAMGFLFHFLRSGVY